MTGGAESAYVPGYVRKLTGDDSLTNRKNEGAATELVLNGNYERKEYGRRVIFSTSFYSKNPTSYKQKPPGVVTVVLL